MNFYQIVRPVGGETEFGIRLLRPATTRTDTAGQNFIFELPNEWIWPDFHEKPIEWDPSARLEEYGIESLPSRTHHNYFQSKDWLAMSNKFLGNAARLYLDGTHPEISTPLCINPLQFVTYNQACYRIVDSLRKRYETEQGKFYVLYRNNVARDEWHNHSYASDISPERRVSYAFHENYTVSRSVSKKDLIQKTLPWLVLRMIIIGAGKVGSDRYFSNDKDIFQISQRADFHVMIADAGTTGSRPIYNTRDVPYADRGRFRRVHNICSDSNMLELPEYLKIGLTSILFDLQERGLLNNRFEILDPVSAIANISHDTNLVKKVWLLEQKRSRRALDCLKDYCDLFQWYVASLCKGNAMLHDVTERFGLVLELLSKKDLGALYGKLDWVTKRCILENYLSKKRKGWSDPEARQLDAEYHNNNHDSGLFYKLIYPTSERITSDEMILKAMAIPPATRSQWMLRTALRYRIHVTDSNYWHRITFRDPDHNSYRKYVIYFGDPYLKWDGELAEKLFKLPLMKFLESAEREIQGVELNHERGYRAYEPPEDFSYLTASHQLLLYEKQ